MANDVSKFRLRAGVDDDLHKDVQRKTGFWGAQGAGCVVVCPGTKRLLMGLRGPDCPEPLTWGGWGGALDDGEDPKAGAKRELREESGYSGPCRMERLFVYRNQGFQFTNYLCLVPKEFTPALSSETSEYLWCTWEKLPTPFHFGFKAVLQNSSAKDRLLQYL